MGLLYADVDRLWTKQQSGVSFARTLTVSRQQLYLHDPELQDLRRRHPMRESLLAGYRFGEYSDRFWKEVMGLDHVHTLDFSDYEGAGIVHDLNHWNRDLSLGSDPE